MKKILLVTIITSFFIGFTMEALAQNKLDTGSVVYSLQYSKSGYNMMQGKYAKEGIKTSEFGNWLAQNGQVSIVLKPGQELMQRQNPAIETVLLYLWLTPAAESLDRKPFKQKAQHPEPCLTTW
jgi:hypothetical protein